MKSSIFSNLHVFSFIIRFRLGPASPVWPSTVQPLPVLVRRPALPGLARCSLARPSPTQSEVPGQSSRPKCPAKVPGQSPRPESPAKVPSQSPWPESPARVPCQSPWPKSPAKAPGQSPWPESPARVIGQSPQDWFLASTIMNLMLYLEKSYKFLNNYKNHQPKLPARVWQGPQPESLARVLVQSPQDWFLASTIMNLMMYL